MQMSDQSQVWSHRIEMAGIAVAILIALSQGYYSQQGVAISRATLEEMRAQREQDKRNSVPSIQLQETRREFVFRYRNKDRGLVVPANVEIGKALNVGNGGGSATFTRWEPIFWDFEHEHPPPSPPYLDDPDLRRDESGLDRRHCVPPNIPSQGETSIKHFSRSIADLVPYKQKGKISGNFVVAGLSYDGELCKTVYPFQAVITPEGESAKIAITFVQPRPKAPNN